MTFNDKLNFSDTVALVNAIEEVALWSTHLENARVNRSDDTDDIKRMENWVEKAKQKAFDIATK